MYAAITEGAYLIKKSLATVQSQEFFVDQADVYGQNALTMVLFAYVG